MDPPHAPVAPEATLKSLKMNPVRTVWLWMIVVALLLLVAFAVSYELAGSAATGWPWWVWGLLAAAVFIFLIGLIFMVVAFVREGQRVKAYCATLEHSREPEAHHAPDRRAPDVCPQTGKKTLASLQCK